MSLSHWGSIPVLSSPNPPNSCVPLTKRPLLLQLVTVEELIKLHLLQKPDDTFHQSHSSEIFYFSVFISTLTLLTEVEHRSVYRVRRN